MEERRQDYPRIIDALDEIKTHLAEVVTKVEERNNAAIDWRESVCIKVKEMKNYCQARQADKTRLWTAILLAFAIPVISVVFMWGVTQEKLVNLNKGEIEILNLIRQYHPIKWQSQQ